MRKPEKGPRGGLVVWLMVETEADAAQLAESVMLTLARAMHPIAADIAVLSLTAYAISAHSRQ